MEERKIKSHLIITDIHDDYHINWCGKILDAKPKIENGKPIFVIVGSRGRIETNTVDMRALEKIAKSLTEPRGHAAITSDSSRIYIKEISDNEKLLGVLTHKRIKSYAPMYDKVGYR